MSSNEDFTPTVNVDAVMESIYRLQANLKIFAEQLACNPTMPVSEEMLWTLAHMTLRMECGHPSLRRH